jgi:hypothetical protein
MSSAKLVKIGVTGGRVEEYAFNGDSLRKAIESAGHVELLQNNYTVRVNGSEVKDLSVEVQDGDLIILAETIKGNR